jgi:hypothetical protein
MSKAGLTGILASFALAASATVASAQELRDFTEVETVCAECAPPEKHPDAVTLTDGRQLRVQVIAENPDLYVLRAYGEARAVGKDQVEDIQWGEDRSAAALDRSDQVLLRNGHVLIGTLAKEHSNPDWVLLDSGLVDVSVYAFADQVDRVYRAGARHQPWQ